jgi:hypothetical protein
MLPLLVVLLAPACGGSSVAPAPRLWTMVDLQTSLHQQDEGLPCSNPGGLPCNYFVNHASDGRDILQLKVSFSEGWFAAYITTDFWDNYGQIWLQPMYFLVTAWNDQAPAANRFKKPDGSLVGPIFSVGTDSAFYSPYWQVFYVEVPADTPPTKYTSERQLFEAGLIRHAGPNRFASIGPADLSLPNESDVSDLISGYLVNQELDVPGVVASAKKLSGWIDGVAVSYVDFGLDGFAADADSVIQDVPLFLFRQRDANGDLKLIGAPNVAGVAPLFSGVSGQIGGDNRPHFGALWRIHFVDLPASAKEFMKEDQAALGLDASDAFSTTHLLRVALNANPCFATIADFDSCVWLDSQAAIEDNLGPRAIERSALEPACPFVAWHNAPVPNP